MLMVSICVGVWRQKKNSLSPSSARGHLLGGRWHAAFVLLVGEGKVDTTTREVIDIG